MLASPKPNRASEVSEFASFSASVHDDASSSPHRTLDPPVISLVWSSVRHSKLPLSLRVFKRPNFDARDKGANESHSLALLPKLTVVQTKLN